MSVLEKIQSVNEVNKSVKVLVYGEPGVGKTTFAASAPSPLFIDADRGVLSLIGRDGSASIKVLVPSSFDELLDLVFELRAGKLPEVKTLVLDTITELQNRTMDENLKIAVEESKGRRNPYLPQLQDYGLNGQMLRRITIALSELDRHLIILAHEKEDKDDDRLFVRPAVTPKLAETLVGMMDVIGYMTLEADGSRKLQVQPTRRVWAKSRLQLPASLTNPTFDLLIKTKEKVNGQAGVQ